jgi:serine/threonine protein kinase
VLCPWMFPGATYQTLMGLRHLHSHKLVRRDLSMQNILLHVPSNCAKIADVGLAVCASNFVFDRHISTLLYRALEVFLGVQALDFEQTTFDMRPFASIMGALFFGTRLFRVRVEGSTGPSVDIMVLQK